MITFITGVPGASKTLNTIKMVDKDWSTSGRPIYYRGIRDLTLDWNQVQDEELLTWWEFPEGSIFVIDEAQQIWPGRANNRPVPESIKRMDTHRHGGYDFYVITQKHTMVDHALRYFVGRHIHLERQFGFNGARMLDFNKAVDPDDPNAQAEAVKSRIQFDKKYFDKYKSAEVHTFKKRIPTKAYVIGALMLAAVLVGVNLVSGIQDRAEGPQVAEVEQITAPGPQFALPGVTAHADPELTPEEYAAQWVPRIEDIPYSAPAYDELTEVKTYPRPQCMVLHRTGRCRCYTQQATPLSMSQAACLDIVDNGWFNPFVEEGEALARAQPASVPPVPLPPPEPARRHQVIYLGDGGPNPDGV